MNEEVADAPGITEGIVNRVDGSLSGLTRHVDAKFSRVDNLMLAVLAVLVVMVITLIFMVATMLVDAWRFNSVTYKEYSSKVDTLNDLRSSNTSLIEENIGNQRLILEQQNRIIEILGN